MRVLPVSRKLAFSSYLACWLVSGENAGGRIFGSFRSSGRFGRFVAGCRSSLAGPAGAVCGHGARFDGLSRWPGVLGSVLWRALGDVGPLGRVCACPGLRVFTRLGNFRGFRCCRCFRSERDSQDDYGAGVLAGLDALKGAVLEFYEKDLSRVDDQRVAREPCLLHDVVETVAPVRVVVRGYALFRGEDDSFVVCARDLELGLLARVSAIPGPESETKSLRALSLVTWDAPSGGLRWISFRAMCRNISSANCLAGSSPDCNSARELRISSAFRRTSSGPFTEEEKTRWSMRQQESARMFGGRHIRAGREC